MAGFPPTLVWSDTFVLVFVVDCLTDVISLGDLLRAQLALCRGSEMIFTKVVHMTLNVIESLPEGPFNLTNHLTPKRRATER